jgi:dephospho-CoA kinase
MFLYGLTGGVGMGKSFVSELLGKRGWKIIDTDLVAREVVARGEPALEWIRTEFGERVMGSDGQLDRRKLGELVFQDEARRHKLEGMLHPLIRNRWADRARQWELEGTEAALVVIPLLYETGAESLVNQVVCVGCACSVQEDRLLGRGWPKVEIERRNQAQQPIEKKMDRADFVIWNNSTERVCELQVDRIFGPARLDARAGINKKDLDKRAAPVQTDRP